MRYVIYGTGAIGGTLAARLHLSGREVVAIARGRHLEAIRERGLRFVTPAGEVQVKLAAVGSPGEVAIGTGDAVVLAMKTQDTPGALDALASSAPRDTPILCAQNGVENERLALRRFSRVFGVVVVVPAAHLSPGEVLCYQQPTHGILDLGGYPTGADELAREFASDFAASGFASVARPDVVRWKYGKLLRNLANVLEAAAGSREGDISERAREEAMACYRAAGIAYASIEEQRHRGAQLPDAVPIQGAERGGGSTWQSLARGQGSMETDYLNGEICLLGRLHRVPTPINDLLQRLGTRLVRDRVAPGSLTLEEVMRS